MLRVLYNYRISVSSHPDVVLRFHEWGYITFNADEESPETTSVPRAEAV